ncbi:hypothetical protein F4779DRAFT_585726 [Xylariaceae sp. FL0662B]|nr:hypothetical protein F4779DRAFT_585726 [Xylariaceae sp. FL0662B]
MARTRKSEIPVDSSWRMVEGENDSLDTTVVHDPIEDDFIVSSGQSQQSASSQGLSFGSQDSIHDFVNKADDDQVILRAPFQPSLASTRHASLDKDRTPVPEFFMPAVDVDSPRHRSTRSSRTVHADTELLPARRRVLRQESVESSPRTRRQTTRERSKSYEPEALPTGPTLTDRFTTSIPEFLFNAMAWCLSIIGMALYYARLPLTILLFLYITIGTGMIAKNMITESINTSLSPFCRIPGASLIGLPFCPDFAPTPGSNQPVEFNELMNVQAQFEKVLEDSAKGVSLPMEMKRSEVDVRDIRTVVKYSELPAREELVYEFDNYIDIVRTASDDLQAFNTHVGSAVDSVISINRWTSRYIDSIAADRETQQGLLSRWGGWLFTPFQPTVFDEHMILDKYIEHTALVSEKIANLIVEAQAALRLLTEAENSLQLIKEHATRIGKFVTGDQTSMLDSIWSFVGVNSRRLKELKEQMRLLQQVEKQRMTAVNQLMHLMHDLKDIETKLSDLRDRVAAPRLLDGRMPVPLNIHIETINAGVERLENARSRIRAEENKRLQQALARSRSEDDKLIDG